MSKVYTLTGDKGTTGLASGKRVRKDCVRVEAYGTVDELNAHIGMLVHLLKQDSQMTNMAQWMMKVQNKLFNIGGYLAMDIEGKAFGLSDDNVKEIEAKIDEMDEQIPPMKGFILPGGSEISAVCDQCRTVTRRAERRVITLTAEAKIDEVVLRYLNRLSDFFFVFARFNNVAHGFDEILWDKNV